jgi:hypothetical protein
MLRKQVYQLYVYFCQLINCVIGWGAWSGGRQAHGPFGATDSAKHSFQRELLAVYLALKTLL